MLVGVLVVVPSENYGADGDLARSESHEKRLVE
jgi:hypothetical protein